MKIDVSGDKISTDFCLFRSADKKNFCCAKSDAVEMYPHLFYQLSVGFETIAIVRIRKLYRVYAPLKYVGFENYLDGYASAPMSLSDAKRLFFNLLIKYSYDLSLGDML